MAKDSIEIQMNLDLENFENWLKRTEQKISSFVKKVEQIWKIVFNPEVWEIKNVEKAAKKAKTKIEESKIEANIWINVWEYEKKLKEAVIYSRDTKKKLDSNLLFKMQWNIVDLENKLEDAKKIFKKLDWEVDKQREIKLNINNIKSELTEAKRELRNYVNTWEKELSRLWKLFQDNSIFTWLKNWFIKAAWIIWWISTLFKWAYDFMNQFSEAYQKQESAFAWVKKTVNATGEEFKQLDKDLKNLAKQIPVTYEELAQIAETAGQMWIWKENIIEFTEAIAKLWTAISWVSKEEAAQTMVRILDATWQWVWHITALSDSLVNLWNNFKANEGQILDFSNRIFWAWAIAKMSWEDILAIATAFTDVWLSAEAGWSTVSKAIIKMNTAVAEWGQTLNDFASVAWMTAQEFKKLWEEDSAQAFAKFVEWLGTADSSMAPIIQELIWKSSEVQRAFLSMWNSPEVLINALKKTKESVWAMEEEFSKRLETVDSKLQINANKWEIWKWNIWESLSWMKVWLSNFFTTYIPLIFWYFQRVIVTMAGAWKLLPLYLEKALTFVWWMIAAFFAWFFDFLWWAVENAWIIAGNIWKAFYNLPRYLWLALEKATNFIFSWIDNVWSALNSLTEAVWMWPLFWKIGRVDFWIETVKYESLKSFWTSNFDKVMSKYKSRQTDLSQEIAINKEVIWKYYDKIWENEDINSAEVTKKAREKEEKRLKAENKWKSEALQKYLDNLQNWEWKWGWWKWKEKKNLKEKIDKEIEEIKRKTQEELNAIDKLAISEEERLQKKRAVYEKVQKEIDRLKKDSFEIDEEQLKKLEQIQEEINKNFVEKTKEGQNIAQKYYDSLIEDAKKYWEELDKIHEKQKSINEKMEEATKKKTEKLADRYLKIDDEIEKIQKQKDELNKKWLDENYVRVSDYNFAKKIWKEKIWTNNYTWDDILKYKELLQQERKLLEEKEVLDWKRKTKYNKSWDSLLTWIDIWDATERARMNESERILESYNQEKEKLEKELKDLKNQENEKQKLYDETVKLKENAEKIFTDFVKIQTTERIWEMEKMKQKAREIAEEMAKLWFTWQWFKAEYLKRNSDWSITRETKIINYNNINTTVNDVKATGRVVNKTLLDWVQKWSQWISDLTTKK